MTQEKNLTERAYAIIRDTIMHGELKEGDAVSISALADKLGISRTPVANACQRLEQERFLTVIPKQGVLIKTITIDEAREIYELRAAIETYSAKKVFAALGSEDITYLTHSVDLQKRTVPAKDAHTFMLEDTKFHRYLLSKYPNSQFIDIVDTLYARAFMVGIRCCSNLQRLQSSIEEHEKIIEALRHRDREAFVCHIEENIINGYTSLTGSYTAG